MKNTTYSAIALAFLLFSCGKEQSLENSGLTPSLGGALLVKAVTTGVDPTTQEFTYNNKDLLTATRVTTNTGGGVATNAWTISRDAADRVSRITEELVPVGSDKVTTVTDYFYQDATGQKLRYSKSRITQTGVESYDSSAYEYTGSNISKWTYYVSFDGVNYEESAYYIYTYDARGNILTSRLFADAGFGRVEELQSITYEYDTKRNPGDFKEDAFVVSALQYYATPNNPVRYVQKINTSSPPSTASLTFTYEYRSDDKPSKVSIAAALGQVTTTFTYK